MKAVLLDGVKISEEIKKDLKRQIEKMTTPPELAVVLVGDDPASELYVRLKETSAKNIGLEFHKYLSNKTCYPDISEKELLELIDFLNKDKSVSGIIVQLPLPEKYDTQKIINRIDPKKDVDGFHPKNNQVIPPTVSAIIELLKETKQDLKEKNTLIIAKSDIFTSGLEKYLKKELKIRKIKISQEIPADSHKFEIIIIALGKPKVLKKKMIGPDAIVIDVGINKIKGKTIGDVDPAVSEIAGYLSPVPGGVGPLTVACLLRNVVLLAQK